MCVCVCVSVCLSVCLSLCVFVRVSVRKRVCEAVVCDAQTILMDFLIENYDCSPNDQLSYTIPASHEQYLYKCLYR